jgi:hypothetical protein
MLSQLFLALSFKQRIQCLIPLFITIYAESGAMKTEWLD